MRQSKKIFITGASGGIGSAICDKFFQKKFTLIMTSSSEDKILKLKEKYGNNHYYYKVDISDSKILQNCVKILLIFAEFSQKSSKILQKSKKIRKF